MVRPSTPSWSRRCSRRSSPASRRPTCRCRCRHGRWWYVTRTDRGPVVPGLLPRPRSDRRRAGDGDPRLQRRGRGPRLLRRPRRRSVAGPHAAGVVERRRRRRALHAARPRPGHRRRPPRRADRHVVVGRRRLVGRRAVAVLRPPRRADAAVPDLAPPPRHAAGRRRARASRSPTSASTSTSSATRSERVDRHRRAAARRASEVAADPGRRPDGRAACSCAPRADDVEYRVDHWGDRFVVLTNLDAPDFRVMTAPLDDPGEWTELLPHVPGRRITSAEPFAGHLVLHEWSDAQPQVRVLFAATAREQRARLRRRAARPRARRQPGVGHDRRCALSYQSLTTPAVGVRRRRRHRRARRCASRRRRPNVDLDRSTSSTRTWATAPDGTAVPVDVVRHVDTPLDGTAPGVRLRLRLLRGVDAAVVLASPACRCSTAACVWALVHPRGGGELGRRWYLDGKLLHKRNTFTDTIAAAEHLVAERMRRRRPRRASAAAAPAACSSARASRCARTCSPAAVAEVPVRRRRDDDERPDAAAHGHRVGGVGRPARRAVRQLHARLLAVRQHASPADVPGAVRHRRAQRPAGQLPRAGEVGRQAARRRRRRATARCSCAPRWAPATAARAAATTRGATRPAPSRSCLLPTLVTASPIGPQAKLRRDAAADERSGRRCGRGALAERAAATTRRSRRTAGGGRRRAGGRSPR